MELIQNKYEFNAALYNALMSEDESTVLSLCERTSEKGLYILTIHNDTVLHLATYSKQEGLVIKLLSRLAQQHLDKMTRQNTTGNTILHEAATSNQGKSIASLLLAKAPGLLGMRNNLGETALFRSARYGKNEIFRFLASKISEYNQASQKAFLQRRDKTTILHAAILSQHFELALEIAELYPYITEEPDIDGMTALQLLSCNSDAFRKESETSIWKRIIDYVRTSYNSDEKSEYELQKHIYESALKLAKYLIQRDTTWEVTHPLADQSRPKPHKYGSVNLQASPVEKGTADRFTSSVASTGQADGEGETPLFLATKSGCVEIVKEILRLYPQAIEHIDDEGRNILHVAIKYRQLEIFKLVRSMEVPKRRLVRKFDNNSNTILHMVGTKRTDYVPEKLQGPALELQEEMMWFERVKKQTVIHFIDHQNRMKQTAEGLFASANNELRNSAKEWTVHTAEGCSVVAVLIATVAFAAAYTIPGGTNDATGLPVLLNQPLFVVFTITDVFSLAFALTAVVTFLSLLTSSFRLEDFKQNIPNKLMFGFTFLFLSVAMMMVSFAATVLLMIHNKERWTNILLYAVSFFPVSVFALSYFPLYSALSKTYKYLIKKATRAFSGRNRSSANADHRRDPVLLPDEYHESHSISYSNPSRLHSTTSNYA